MKVGLVTSTYPRHEADYAVPWMREQVRHLKDSGVDVSVFAPSYQGLGDHQIDGVPVKRFRYFPAKWERLTHEEGAPNKLRNPLFNLLTIPYLLFGALAARKWARREGLDLVHVHWPFPHGLFGDVVRSATGIPVVSTCHGAELSIGDKKWWARAVLKSYLTRSDSLMANSTDTASRMAAVAGVQPKVIPYGTTVEIRERIDGRDDVPVVLFTGRLIQRKGVEFLVEAVPYILKERQVRVVITGDGDMRPRVEERIKALGLESVVEMKGFVETQELADLYSTSDVYVLPAVYDDEGDTEGLGVTTIEAILYGVPVVASGIGGIIDVVKDRETGLIVPEKDPVAIAGAVLELLADSELRDQLIAGGRAHVQEFFHWPKITSELVRVYEGAVRAQGREGASIGGALA